MDRNTARPEIKKKPPGPNARKWIKLHKRYAAPSTHLYPFVWDFSKPAFGSFCQDPDGNVFLDFAGHVSSAPLGYNHPEIVSLLEELNIDPPKIAGHDFYCSSGKLGLEIQAQLQEKLIKLSKKFDFDEVFLSNSGAEAVENAAKICYQARKASHSVTFERSFHGRTLGALSLTQSKQVHKSWYPCVPGAISLPYCTCRRSCQCGWKVKDSRIGSIAKLEQLLDPSIGILKPEEIAFIIIEPLQGEGGFRVPSKKFMREIGEIKSQFEIPLISDEVQAGLGRTGKFWAIENFDLKPDVIAAAKGLRVGASISSESFFPQEKGRLSSTWGAGDIINSAIACKTLEIIQKEKLTKNARKQGKWFLKKLQELENYEPVSEARGIGLMDALEFKSKGARDKLLERSFDSGLLLLPAGWKTIRFLPPLNVKRRELNIAFEILEGKLKEIGV